jgi:FMN phosphatase YigB (HAD superfamily)
MESVTATPSHPNKHASGLIASNVEDWVFDLDNTIYPAASSLFPRVARRMTEWIMDHFELPEDKAAELKTRLFRQYGTTEKGWERGGVFWSRLLQCRSRCQVEHLHRSALTS